MQALIYSKGNAGLSTNVLVADLSDRTAEVEWTHAALWGPLTARITWKGTLDEAFTAADQWLGNGLRIVDPAGQWQWEGLIWTVAFHAGRRSRVRSLEGYASRIMLHYRKMNYLVSPPEELDAEALAQSHDADLEALYGIHTYQSSAGELSVDMAAETANRLLAERKRLLWLPESGTLGSDAGDAAEITLECYGWYRSLWFQPITPITTTGTADVAVVISDLLDLWIPWLSANRDQIETTGTLVSRQFLDYETSGEIIKRLVEATPGYTFGIDKDRIPYLRPHKREQATADYHEDLFGLVTTATGLDVPLWEVRPDTILRQTDFVPSSTNLANEAIAAIENVYLVETTFNASAGTLTYRSSVAGERGEVES